MSTITNQLERVKRKFAALCYNHLISHAGPTYINAVAHLKVHNLSERRHQDALFY